MKKQDITRRELLKVLTAAGTGITAAAFLPARWVKPVVGSGVLPVHAQASQPPAPGSISGAVTDNFGQPMLGQQVDLYAGLAIGLHTGLKAAKPKPIKQLNLIPIDDTLTNSLGEYLFEGLQAGDYHLECTTAFIIPAFINVVVTAGNVSSNNNFQQGPM